MNGGELPSTAAPGGVISRVRSFTLGCRLPRPYGDSQGLKHERGALVVRLETSEGLVGWGETHGRLGLLKLAVDELLAPELLGADPLEGEALWRRLAARAGETTRALSAVDTALWDLRGHALGVPVATLLGGALHTRLSAYAAGGYYGEPWDAPGALGAWAATCADRGFHAVKMKIGGLDIPRDLERVSEVVAAVAGRAAILVDANGAYDRASALAVGRALDENGVAWFEDPLDVRDVNGYRELRGALDLLVGGAEDFGSAHDFAQVVEAGAMDVLMPDLGVAGGIGPVKRVADVADAYGVAVAPHTWSTALQQAANLQLLATLPTSRHSIAHGTPMLEFDTGDYPLREAILEQRLAPGSDGLITLPTAPGLGVTVDESALEAFAA